MELLHSKFLRTWLSTCETRTKRPHPAMALFLHNPAPWPGPDFASSAGEGFDRALP